MGHRWAIMGLSEGVASFLVNHERSGVSLLKGNSFLIRKSQLAIVLAWLMLIVVLLWILPSGFRGDVGPDSHTYRVIYEQGASDSGYLYFSKKYGFEPGFSVFIVAVKKIGVSYEGLQLIVAVFSMLSVLFVFKKVKPVNFVVFVFLYLCFVYYQLQWSVIRNSVAFWLFCVSLMFFRNLNFSSLISSFFHYSFFLTFFRFRLVYFIVGAIPVSVLMYFYVEKYSSLSLELLYSFFLGGWSRLAYHFFLTLTLLYLLCFSRLSIKYIREHEPAVAFFILVFSAGMLFPLGWRLVAVAIPFLLLVDFKFITIRRFMLFFLMSIIIFIQKSYYFTMAELGSGDYPVLNFLYDFYFRS
ncbi:EpsG family protein [Marinobacter sp. 1Y8]